MVSEEITAKGISKHLKYSPSYTSFLINKLEREDLISRSKAKVILGNRTQDSIFLSDTGLKLAKELKANLTRPWKNRK